MNNSTNFFIKNDLISSQQYGFQKNCSTSDAVVDIYNNLIKNIENEVITCSIFLDLAKAYDTIDHRILIAKLEKYGIRGVPLQLIESFLTNRHQYTTMKSTKSATNKVLCGIPQGSTPGPLLFTIYINDLPLASDFKVHLFADDTNLTLTHSQPEILQQKVNENMQKIINWMRINKLSINYSKSEFMIITKKQFKHKFEVVIEDNKIKQKLFVKYLSILIDDKLNWKHQVKQICSKIARGSWALYHIRNYVDKQTMKRVYYSLVYSHLQYCINSWGSASETTLHPLKMIQKRSIRIITGSKYRAHAEPLFHQLQCLKLNDIYKLEMAKLMYRINNSMISPTKANDFQLISQCHDHGTRLRNNRNYCLPRVRAKLGQNMTIFSGTKIWNGINKQLKELSFRTFKKTFKNQLISKYYSTT